MARVEIRRQIIQQLVAAGVVVAGPGRGVQEDAALRIGIQQPHEHRLDGCRLAAAQSLVDAPRGGVNSLLRGRTIERRGQVPNARLDRLLRFRRSDREHARAARYQQRAPHAIESCQRVGRPELEASRHLGAQRAPVRRQARIGDVGKSRVQIAGRVHRHRAFRCRQLLHSGVLAVADGGQYRLPLGARADRFPEVCQEAGERGRAAFLQHPPQPEQAVGPRHKRGGREKQRIILAAVGQRRVVHPALFAPLRGGAEAAESLVHQVPQTRQVLDAPIGMEERQLHPLDGPPRFRDAVAGAADHQFVAVGGGVEAEAGVQAENLVAQPLGHFLIGDRLAVFDHAYAGQQLRQQRNVDKLVFGHAI